MRFQHLSDFKLTSFIFVNLCTESRIMKQKPAIPKKFLWEYDTETFNYDKSYKIVIERVLEMGNIQQWQIIFQYYGEQKILETIEWSAQLSVYEKEFSKFFLKSDLVNVA
jgi:hypothetical protein